MALAAVLVALSVIFVIVQLLMMGARAAVQRNDRRLAERLEQKRSEREG